MRGLRRLSFQANNFHAPLTSSADGWNSAVLSRQYFHHSEFQRQHSFATLCKFHPNFSHSEKILDYGCGDGKGTALISRLTSAKVVGVDVSPNMIQFAQNRFPQSNFPNLSFSLDKSMCFQDYSDRHSTEEEDKFDVITSFFVFHLVSNPLQTLLNLRKVLQPEGKLIGICPVTTHPSFFQATQEVLSQYGIQPAAATTSEQLSMVDASQCTQLLRLAGFQDPSVDVIQVSEQMMDETELIDWCVGTLTANWGIPVDISRQVFTNIVSRYLQIHPQAKNTVTGFVEYHNTMIQFKAS